MTRSHEIFDQKFVDSQRLVDCARDRGDLSEILELPGVDIDFPDARGRSALCWAALHGNSRNVLALLNVGACTNQADSRGHTPLFFSLWQFAQAPHDEDEALKVFNMLLHHGACVNRADDNGHLFMRALF